MHVFSLRLPVAVLLDAFALRGTVLGVAYWVCHTRVSPYLLY